MISAASRAQRLTIAVENRWILLVTSNKQRARCSSHAKNRAWAHGDKDILMPPRRQGGWLVPGQVTVVQRLPACQRSSRYVMSGGPGQCMRCSSVISAHSPSLAAYLEHRRASLGSLIGGLARGGVDAGGSSPLPRHQCKGRSPGWGVRLIILVGMDTE